MIEPVEYSAVETKLFNGIAYSVSLVKDSSCVHILMGNGDEAIDEEISFPDVSPGDHGELFNRGHTRAQQLIQSNDLRIKAAYRKIDKSGIDDA